MTVAENQKRLVIVGATGMIGGDALRYALDHPAVGGATAIGRKPTGLGHAKLKEALHQASMVHASDAHEP
jgi:N-acetyl-gamma-glutamylphosphate reductase